MPEVVVFAGSLIDARVDAIATSTNPWLSLQAGTGGAVRMAGGPSVQLSCDELVAAARARTGKGHFAPGNVLVGSAGRLHHEAVLHCVAADAFHHSSATVVTACVAEALRLAAERGWEDVALPALATGDARLGYETALSAMAEGLIACPPALRRVLVAVRDVRRAETAREVLASRLGHPVPVEFPGDDALERDVAGLYMSVLAGSYASTPSSESRDFAERARRALGSATLVGVRGLLWWRDWRPRLVGAWLAGLAGHRALENRLGRLLYASELTFAGQGYCFALACLGGDGAASHLARYLETWLPRLDCPYDQAWAMAALRRVAPARAAGLEPLWRSWSEANLEATAERLAPMIEMARHLGLGEP